MNDLYRDIPAKWVGCCAKCGRDGLKKNMSALYLKTGKDPVRVLCYVCPDCLAVLLDELGVGIPGG